MRGAIPILNFEAASAWEGRRLGCDEEAVWAAMTRAGKGVAARTLADYAELGSFPRGGRVLILAGKGHNGGDALLAAGELLRRVPGLLVDVILAFEESDLKPLTLRAWKLLLEGAGGRVSLLSREAVAAVEHSYAVCIDGLFGFRFRPPLAAASAALLAAVAKLHVDLRVAVDVPSGLNEPGAFHADFTYATGIVKRPLLSCMGAGRIRYVDTGFFAQADDALFPVREWALCPALLDPLRKLRPSGADKRSFGHVFLLGGSRNYPGAILMAVLGALRSGAGLVTAFVPESLVASFAARAPEAMWVAWPETPEGGLALEGLHLIEERLERASSLVIGPGLGRERETLAMVELLVRNAKVPLVLDADSLQPAIVKAGSAPRILTPHAGEFLRVAGGMTPEAFSVETTATVVLKGPLTRIAQGGISLISLCGGPVLARGGSGDLLAGLMGGLLAQAPDDPWMAAARSVQWQGIAADLLARHHGQLAVSTTDLLPYLSVALRQRLDE